MDIKKLFIIFTLPLFSCSLLYPDEPESVSLSIEMNQLLVSIFAGHDPTSAEAKLISNSKDFEVVQSESNIYKASIISIDDIVNVKATLEFQDLKKDSYLLNVKVLSGNVIITEASKNIELSTNSKISTKMDINNITNDYQIIFE